MMYDPKPGKLILSQYAVIRIEEDNYEIVYVLDSTVSDRDYYDLMISGWSHSNNEWYFIKELGIK